MTDRIFKVDPSDPQPEIINNAAEIIKNSGVVIFPTWCLYGLAADAFNPSAVKEIFNIKKRKAENPLLILIKNRNELPKLVTEIPESAVKLMDKFWPGRITIVFKAKKTISDVLTAGTGKIGVRLPEHPVALALLSKLSNPVTGTSANISNTNGCSNLDEMPESIIKQTGLALDAGPLKGGTGSTIIDVSCNPPKIIREGEIPAEDVRKCLG